MTMQEIVNKWIIEKFGSVEAMCEVPMLEMEGRIMFAFSAIPPNPHYTYAALDEIKRLRKENEVKNEQ